jgi:hypothetical protein
MPKFQLFYNIKMEVKKKNFDVVFSNVSDPNTKKQIFEVVNCPKDASNFIFWTKKNEPMWGLTIKSIPSADNKEFFSSQHTWKMTWYCNEKTGDSLKIARNSESLGSDITDASFKTISDIYNLYKK